MSPSQPIESPRLGTPFASHMVLQRDQPQRIWGWDLPEQTVDVRVESPSGELKANAHTRASGDGSWSVTLPALPAGGPYRVLVAGSTPIVLGDVWLGELWVASGQSNMEWTVAQAADAEATIESANDDGVRYLYVARVAAREARQEVDAEWRVVSPETVGNMSAVAYAFAVELRRELGVPVGIVDASWGGTWVEAWTSHQALARVMDVAARLAKLEAEERNIDEIRARYQADLAAWEAKYLPADPGNRGQIEGWAEREAELGDWQPIRVPSIWQREGLKFNGVVWFRTSFTLPEAWRGRDLELSLGRIDDFDHSYVNGVLVGSHPKGTPEAFDIPRVYQVPARLVRLGVNTLAVRVFDHFGEGGFLDAARALHVRLRDSPSERVSLAGTWVYRVEYRVPLVPASVFEHFPPTPAVLRPQDRPSALYNGMIAPLLPMGVGGFIWYQGESNAEEHASYGARFVALIRDWRERFQAPEAPFYFVQLASFEASLDWAFLREAQDHALGEPHTGRAVTLDIGDRYDIHPKNKREVGRRLALLALERRFERSEIIDSGPECDSVTERGGEVVIAWRNAAGLTTVDGAPPRAFEVAGAAGNFVPASATLDGERVVLGAEGIREVLQVRYAFSDCPDVNLVNAAGLPAAPFRWSRREGQGPHRA